MIKHETKYEIELVINEDYEYIEVLLTGEIDEDYVASDGFQDAGLTVGNITWDKSKHTAEENAIIEEHIEKGFVTITVHSYKPLTKEYTRVSRQIPAYQYICDMILEDYSNEAKYAS